MWISLVLLTVSMCSSEYAKCGGDYSDISVKLSHSRSTITRTLNQDQIRISYYYSNFNLGTAAQNTDFTSTVLPAVTSFFTTTLLVNSVIGNLVLTTTNCGPTSPINVPVPVPSDYTTTGVPNTDIVIFLTTTSVASTGLVALSAPCELQNNALNNPIAGYTVIYSSTFNGLSYSSKLAAMTHEFTHILAFASGLFYFWKDSAGQFYSLVTNTTIVRGVTKKVIVTPNVVNAARVAFNCPDINGVEIEDMDPGNSHWDRRIMFNDYMNSIIPSFPYWSTITLALFEDSGWYSTNSNLAIAPVFGTTSGCNFFKNKCATSGVSADPAIWCTSVVNWVCDPLALNKGSCSIFTYSSIPAALQYFSSQTTGGDIYSDYCPTVVTYSNGRCRGDGTTATYTIAQANEVLGINSRCFISNLVTSPSTLAPGYSACYQVISCTSTYATVAIGSATLNCPFTGGTYSVTGYTGTITCPNSKILCQDIPCQNMCSARGTCSLGVCGCFSGYGGTDCSVKCSTNCISCTSTACKSCKSGYTVSSGSCVACPSNCITCSSATTCTACASGFYKNSNLCSACSANCLTCSSLIACSSCTSGYIVSSGSCIVSCVPYCVSCSGSICLVCDSGHTLVSGGTCQ